MLLQLWAPALQQRLLLLLLLTADVPQQRLLPTMKMIQSLGTLSIESRVMLAAAAAALH
jgi:hypothetical protein